MSRRVIHPVRSEGMTSSRIGPLGLTAQGVPDATALNTLFEERDFQRACQAYLGALPIVARAQWQNQHEAVFGARDGDIVKYRTVRDKLGAITADPTGPFAVGFVNTARTGPMVVDWPQGEARGGVGDFRGRSICGLGLNGPDGGRGGRYLLLGPGQTPPEGLVHDFVARSPTFNLCHAFRIVSADPGESDRFLNACRLYPAGAASPRKTRVIRPEGRPWSGTPPVGMAFWRRLNQILQVEPVAAEDVFLMRLLTPLGLEKGRPFAPDAEQTRALEAGAEIGRLMAFEDRPVAAGPGDPGRAIWVRESVGPTERMIGPPDREPVCLSARRDAHGQWFDGGRAYGLHVPGGDAGQDWSVALYDLETGCFIDTPYDVAERSSHDALSRYPDGSIDLIFSAQPPADAPRSNWIPTVPGRSWFAWFRSHGRPQARDATRDATRDGAGWILPDIEAL